MRRFLMTTTAKTAKAKGASSAKSPKPFKFFERKDRYETFKAVDDLEFSEPTTNKAELLGRKKLLEKEKLYEKQHPAHTTSLSKINKFVAAERGALDFNRLAMLKTNTYQDICKLVLGTTQDTFDAVNCSTAILQLAKTPEKQQQTTEANLQVFSKLFDTMLALPKFPPRQTSNALYGLAIGKFTSVDLEKQQQVISKLVKDRKDWTEWEPQNMATAAWSLAKLRQDELTEKLLVEIARQARLVGMRRFNTHDLAQLEFAFAKTKSLRDPQAFHLCSAITRNRGFPSFTTANLVSLFQNLLQHQQPQPNAQFLNHLCEEIGNRDFYSSNEIALLWECFAKCISLVEGFAVEPDFLLKTVQQMKKDFAKLDNRKLVAQLVPQLSISDPELLQLLSAKALVK
ncbi:hypothetical protein BASA81_013754 [Batrachochytrium salamandrivorans]|nr:hypothetical protein BASA81_013754 [Batrachochytrium salamandrivorans]